MRRTSSRQRKMGGKHTRRSTVRGRKAASTRASAAGGSTKAALYRRAKRAGIEGRSKMSKSQLQKALRG